LYLNLLGMSMDCHTHETSPKGSFLYNKELGMSKVI
jgi:hypothetical protein